MIILRHAAPSLAVLFCGITCFAAKPDTSRIDPIFAQWDRKDSAGMAIVVVRDGAVAYQHGYGYANLEHRIPITPQTVFDVASVAKQFTGLAIAMLINEGKLAIDDDIQKYLPEVPDFGNRITIGHLLHHTSGLRDWPETLTLAGVDSPAAPITLDMILEMVRCQRELDFAPGEEHLYSNTGYNLLAATIAKITGQSFRSWTDKNLFQPLTMKHTHVRDDPAEIVPNFAESYAPVGNGKYARMPSGLAAQGSSSLLVSAEDTGKWLLNFETARVGGKATIKLMQQPGKLNNGEKVNYGFGIGLGDYHGSPTITHSGSWAGYRSFLLWIADKRFGIAVLANTADADTRGLAMKVTDLYLADSSNGKSPALLTKTETKPRKASTKPDPSSWDRFPGTYRLGPGWLLTITRDNDQLMTQATNEDKFKMRATSQNTFFVDAYGAAVEFVPDAAGTVNHLLYRGINAPKLSIPELTPERLASYTGDYWSEELQVVARLEIHDQKLAWHHRSGLWIHFLPTGPNRFDADRGGFTFEFDCDSSARPTQVKVSGGRVRNIRYTRVLLPNQHSKATAF